MSRSFLGFLLFCVLLAATSAGVVWYVGPTLAGIVIDESRRAHPFFLLQLLPSAATRAGSGDSSYRARFVTLAAEDDARLLWQGGAVDVVEGSVLLDVAGAQVLRFPTGADLVQMLTSSAYRALQSDAGGTIRQLGSSAAPELAADRATVLVLYRLMDQDVEAPLGVAGQHGWLSLLPRYGGRVSWDAAVAPLRSPEGWNRVLVLQFPDAPLARAWLDDPATVTERAIAARHLDAFTALLVQSAGSAPR